MNNEISLWKTAFPGRVAKFHAATSINPAHPRKLTIVSEACSARAFRKFPPMVVDRRFEPERDKKTGKKKKVDSSMLFFFSLSLSLSSTTPATSHNSIGSGSPRNVSQRDFSVSKRSRNEHQFVRWKQNESLLNPSFFPSLPPSLFLFFFFFILAVYFVLANWFLWIIG